MSRRTASLAALLLLFPLAGCITPGAAVETTGALPQAGALPTMTRWEWSSVDLRGDAHLAVTVRLLEDADCEAEMERAGTAGRGARSFAGLVHESGQFAYSSGSGPYRAQVHVARALDTRTIDPATGKWASGSEFDIDLDAGNVTFFATGKGLEAWENPLTEYALRLVLKCDSPFEVVSVHGSREVLIFDEETLSGGVGATTSWVGGVAVADEARRVFSSPRVDFHVMGWGPQVGRLSLTHPEGGERWDLIPTSALFKHVPGVQGEWRVGLDHYAGGGFNVLTGALLGSQPLASPDDLLSLEAP